MSSGSLKDVVKSINAIVPQTDLQVPDSLQEVIQAYLDKHTPIEDSDSGRLNDELITIWAKLAKDKPERYPFFLNILRELRPAIRGEQRWLQWWNTLVVPVLGHMAQEKGLASECRKLLLAIMIFEPEDRDTARIESAKATSKAIAEKILEIWLKKSGIAKAEGNQTAKYMEDQIKIVLMELGKRKPQELFNVVNKYFIQSKNRTQMTTLLVDLLAQDAPHLHVMRDTPLFDNLLVCLQVDTDTTVIVQAMTALTMFLPHIPVSSGTYLPSLFNIYTRMLFWDEQRNPSSPRKAFSDDGQDWDIDLPANRPKTPPWEKLSFSGDATDETLPDILHYFTFLYGLYPMNFMAYIRKPTKWLKERSLVAGPYFIEMEKHEVQKRSVMYSAQHLLHPHFLSHTIETEITDAERWRQHAASDVATFCMTLIQPLAVDPAAPVTPTFSQAPSHEFSRTFDLKRSERGLLTRSSSHETFHTHRSHDGSGAGVTSNPTSGLNSRHMSQVLSPDGTGEFSQLARLSSRASASASSNADVVSPGTVIDSRPDMAGAGTMEAVASLESMLASQHTARSNLRHSIRNDSSTTLSTLADTSHHANANVDTYLNSLPPQNVTLQSALQSQQVPRSPSLRPTTENTSTTIEKLQREANLLKNELNFEKYLKQQHFTHIGKLRRQQIREAQADAELQSLLNENRKLKVVSMRDKEDMQKIKKEADLSRQQSRKWEADVTAKLRNMKEEQRKWEKEKEFMKAELENLKFDNEGMKALIIKAEEREHQISRRLAGAEIQLESVVRLEAERDKLKQRLRRFLQQEKGEEEREAERERQESRIGMLQMQVEVKAKIVREVREAATKEIEELKAEIQSAKQDGRKEATAKFQTMIDSALDASRRRMEDAQRLQQRFRERITRLEEENLALKEQESRDKLAAMRTLSSESRGHQPIKSINSNPLVPYTSSESEGAAEERAQIAKTQSTPALPIAIPHIPNIPRYDAQGQNFSMYGGGSRLVSSPSPRKERDERKTPSTPGILGRVLGRGASSDGSGRKDEDRGAGRGQARDEEGGASAAERAKSPKPKNGDTALLFGRGRTIYDAGFLR